MFWDILLGSPGNEKYWNEAAAIGLLGVVEDGSDKALPAWTSVIQIGLDSASQGGDVAGMVTVVTGSTMFRTLAKAGDIVGFAGAGLACVTGQGCMDAMAEAFIGAIPYVGALYFVFKLVAPLLPEAELTGHGGGGFWPTGDTDYVSSSRIDPGRPILLA